jgi:hypothetical protein
MKKKRGGESEYGGRGVGGVVFEKKRHGISLLGIAEYFP